MHQGAAQWIGEDAVKAADAYAQGDYDTLKACLESIQYYAMELGYVPGHATEEEDPCPATA
jgi:hypothetical protein